MSQSFVGREFNDTVAALNKKNVFSKISAVALFLWTFIVLSDNLKMLLLPKIHWIATFALLPIILLDIWNNRKNLSKKIDFWHPWLGILFSLIFILSSFFVHDRKLYTALEGCKLFIILSFYLLLMYKKDYIKVLISAFAFCVALNFIFLIFGQFFDISFFSWNHMGAYRKSTLLTETGPLSSIGICFFFYALYNTVCIPKKTVFGIFLLIPCVFLIVSDGARISLISVFFSYVFLIFLEFYLKKRLTFYFLSKLALSVFVFLIIAIYPIFLSGKMNDENRYIAIYKKLQTVSQEQKTSLNKGTIWDYSVFTKADRYFSLPSSNPYYFFHPKTILKINGYKNDYGNFSWLKILDSARFQMFSLEKNIILSHPFLGSGFGSTGISETITNKNSVFVGYVDVDQTFFLHLHNAYLQVWSDIGVLAFICFVAFCFGWIFCFHKIIFSSKKISNSELPIFFNSLFLMFYFVFRNFFYPISTEWIEWIFFLVSSAIVFSTLSNQKKETV